MYEIPLAVVKELINTLVANMLDVQGGKPLTLIICLYN